MKKLRLFLIKLLVGDMSYMRNCTLYGKVQLRRNHFVECCTLANGSYIFVDETTRWPELKDPSDEKEVPEVKP